MRKPEPLTVTGVPAGPVAGESAFRVAPGVTVKVALDLMVVKIVPLVLLNTVT